MALFGYGRHKEQTYMQTRSFYSVPKRAIHTATQISMIMKTFTIAIKVSTWHTSCYLSCLLDICNILREVWLACAFCLEDSKSHMDHSRGLFCDTWNDLGQFFCHHEKLGIGQFTLCLWRESELYLLYDLSIIINFTRLISSLNPDFMCSLCRLWTMMLYIHFSRNCPNFRL
jgi:hypothetical protein